MTPRSGAHPGRAEHPEHPQLAQLADLFDVQTSYVDVDGQERQVSPDSVRAVLAALGADVTDVAGAVRAERMRRHTEVLEPVVAFPALGAQTLTVGLGRHVHPRDCWLSSQDEGGAVRRTRLMPAIQRPVGSSSREGVAVDRFEAQVATPVSPLEPGYHRLRVEGPGIDVTALGVVAPHCPVPPRGWGAFLPLHALRTNTDWGVGTYPALGSMTRWLRSLGGDLMGTLPLYPAYLGGPAAQDPVEISPYLPVTRLGWNEIYIDPTALPELAIAPEVRELIGSTAFQADLEAARAAPFVDYPGVMMLVRRALEPLARAAFSPRSPSRAAIDAFARDRPDMVAYARFRGAGADARPGTQHDRASRDRSDLSGMNDLARYHFYAQWAADSQLRASGGNLFLDMPVGVHPDGFDTHWEPDAFCGGVEGGAPPDRFYAGGQRWGFRPLHPRGIRSQRYRHPIALLRHVMGASAALRLDHVMGLHRLWWVPEGADARDGAYVGYRDKELRAIVALEAHRAGTAVVGEDLGTVPDGVRRAMAEDRMLRSWVLQFELSADAPLPDPPELSMASIGTHDLPRFAELWRSAERAAWRRVLGPDPRRGLRMCLDHMAAGPASLVLVDVEDLWLERWPHNRPGAGPEAGNWQHRAARTFEEFAVDANVVGSLERVDALRRGREIE